MEKSKVVRTGTTTPVKVPVTKPKEKPIPVGYPFVKKEKAPVKTGG